MFSLIKYIRSMITKLSPDLTTPIPEQLARLLNLRPGVHEIGRKHKKRDRMPWVT